MILATAFSILHRDIEVTIEDIGGRLLWGIDDDGLGPKSTSHFAFDGHFLGCSRRGVAAGYRAIEALIECLNVSGKMRFLDKLLKKSYEDKS